MKKYLLIFVIVLVLTIVLDLSVYAKIDRSEIEPSDALELVSELNLVQPIAAHDGSVYTDENDLVYIL